MLSVLNNEEEYVYAYMVWIVVNNQGQLTTNGEYLFIKDLWVHKNHRRKDAINKFVYLLENHELNTFVKYIYWNNDKHNRLSKLYRRDRLKKLSKE